MEDKAKIIELIRTNSFDNVELAYQLSIGAGLEILEEICDFFIQSQRDCSNFTREIKDFLLINLEEYPNTILSFSWYDTSLEDCPQMEILPDSIGALRSLRFLDLSAMDQGELPYSFKNLINIEELDLSLNRFEAFPSELKGMNKLRKLDLRHNYVEKVNSKDIWNLSSLEELNLEDNLIQVIPDEIKYLENLKKLCLKENPLAESVKKRILKMLPNCKTDLDDKTPPNIFSHATSELSQDAFFTWLIQWSDYNYQKFNANLNTIAQNFVRYLIGGEFYLYSFSDVKVGRQWKGIDVWAKIGTDIFIGIEDKTVSKEHSNQLDRYKKLVREHYDDKFVEIRLIYLKTGNQSKHDFDNIEQKGYKVVQRKNVLEILNQFPVSNDTFNAYLSYLTKIDDQTNSFSIFGNLISNWLACEGFYIELEKNIKDCDWGQVNNPSGAFLGFWYCWMGNNDFRDIYIQIENRFEAGIQVVVKVSDDNISVDLLYKSLGGLIEIGKKYGISLSKPSKFRAGGTSTLAIYNEVFPSEIDSEVNVDKILEKLKLLERVIEEFCEK